MQNLITQYQNFVVDSPESEALGFQLKKKVVEERAKLKADKNSWCRPLYEQIDRLLKKYYEADIPLAQLEMRVQSQLNTWHDKQVKQVKEMQQQLLTEQKQDDANNPLCETVIIHVKQPDKTIDAGDVKGTYSETWKARIIELKLVPVYFNGEQLLYVKESVLNKLARQSKGQNPPSGVEYYQESNAVARSSKREMPDLQ